MTFAEIISLLLQGKKVKREIWLFDFIYFPENGTMPYLDYLIDSYGEAPMLTKQDFESTDWMIVD